MGGVAMKGFWVVEPRKKRQKSRWWFSFDVSEDVDRLAERVDLISRTAMYFYKEVPPDKEEREIYLRLIRAVKSERAKLLLLDLL